MPGKTRHNFWLYSTCIIGGLAVGILTAIGLQQAHRRQVRPQPKVASSEHPHATVSRHPASGTHPVIDVTVGCLLGGVDQGEWVGADEIAPRIAGDERYRVYTLTRYVGEVAGSKVATTEGNEDELALTPPPRPNPEEMLGVAGGWNALPRIPRTMDVNAQAYRLAIQEILATNDMTHARVRVTQAISVDLEDDGQRETLLSATVPRTNYPDAAGRAGDYSLVILQRTIRGQQKTFVLSGQYYPQPNIEEEKPLRFSIAGVLDLNGDGVQEIVVATQSADGGGDTVFTIKDEGIEGTFSNSWDA